MDVVVVGASNTDLTSYVTRLPVPGETIHGHAFKIGFGGKGANQCVMAAKLGATTAIVTKLGDDVFGRDTLANYTRLGVNTDFVLLTPDAATGVAPIAVDDSGQNSIIIVNGANDLLTPAEIQSTTNLISNAKVLVTQLEIKPETTLAAIRIASKAKIQSVFNPAPARPDLDPEFYTLPTIFCLNETEAKMLTGVEIKSGSEAAVACDMLHKRGANTVVLTLGPLGSYVKTASEEFHVPADIVNVVDTSGAGDSFIGALAYYLAKQPQLPFKEMVTRAGRIASISVQKPGTQSSYPSRAELSPELFV